jgi:hypothetical protein
MTATAFDVPTTRHGDVAMALLSAIDAVERVHELRGRNGSEIAVAAFVEDDSPHREERQARRAGMKDALRIRERDWWIKILGIAPQA